MTRLIEWLDDLGHRLHLPDGMQDRLCDWFDRRLGLTDTEMKRRAR
jgi:hypothetical protein